MEYAQRRDISQYRTIAVMNEMHQVYLVQHQETGKIYIKKILDVYHPQIYAYLRQNKITGVPRIVDMYEENQQLTVIEEYISGTSLRELIANGSLSAKAVIQYMCELCDILDQLHHLDPPIIHRDIKPSNVIITSCGHAMLIDFNAAKYLTNVHAPDTVLLGTQGYAAPEQYGFGSSLPQTDIYAMGVMLRELVASLPRERDRFDRLIEKCTRIDPADRYPSAMDLKQALLEIQGKPAGSKKGTLHKLIPPGYRSRTPWKMFIATIVYLMIIWVSMTMEVEGVYGTALWIERFFALLILLSFVFGSFNYCHIQNLIPLCKNKNRLLRYLGILLLDAMLAFSLGILLMIVSSIFDNAAANP